MTSIVRTCRVVPGFRCPGEHLPGCGALPDNRQHGAHGDEWHYVVALPDVAISLRVSTPFCRDERLWPDGAAEGAGLHVHAAFPISRDDVLEPSAPCDVLPGEDRRCWTSYRGGLAAREFFAAHGRHADDPDGASRQPRTFWRALEARLQQIAERCRRDRADTHWMVCPRCQGERTVARSDEGAGA